MSNWFRTYGFARVSDELLIGAYPLDADDVEMLAFNGVRRVLNLVEDAELHGLFGRFDRMDPTAAARIRYGRSRLVGGMRQLGESRPDRSQGAHKARCPQQFAPLPAARRQIAVEPLLVDLVHMQQAVGGAPVIGAVLDVLADNPGALLVAAAEQIAAFVKMRPGVSIAPMLVPVLMVPVVVIVVVRHRPPVGAN